ncbi:Rossmann-like and DUF2520 domain-containing protein [Flavobacterium cerinum]|uniref:F420-dependent NADP oxidoreductase n=1 Tax=Flavobacterium cerinum TaxID=2502784 RepID=A0ABY5IP90_9FLAO|nr:Rossmann-like and DUF2520 domain-containing protein [Flavobacterium cerinum]UUC44648.1 F420-dependent NADP oxidoreductase [Flavobacterium cerinum]
MIKIAIIGSGNVAQHLITVFQKTATVKLVQVFARKKETLSTLVPEALVTSDLSGLKEADLYIIAVSDDAISDIAAQLNFTNKLIVHTSGSSGMEVLGNQNRKGVFYPLQTFSKTKAVDFKTVPLCLECENEADYQLLEAVANAISDKVYRISSEQRQSLHVAAVFSCNFVNHLYQIGDEICRENNIPFEILFPLIQETADKIKTLSPQAAQTGPAIRRDQKTIERHLAFLKDNPERTEIYQLLTESIQKNND